MAGLTYDGIPSTRIDSSTFSGTELLVTTLSGVNLLVAGSASDGRGRLAVAGAGSPVAFGFYVQAGSAIASNVSVNVAFPQAFATIPRVVLTQAISGTNADGSYIGSTITTGFIFFGPSGAAHNYIAIGT